MIIVMLSNLAWFSHIFSTKIWSKPSSSPVVESKLRVPTFWKTSSLLTSDLIRIHASQKSCLFHLGKGWQSGGVSEQLISESLSFVLQVLWQSLATTQLKHNLFFKFKIHSKMLQMRMYSKRSGGVHVCNVLWCKLAPSKYANQCLLIT